MGRIKECFQSNTPQLPARLPCLPPALRSVGSLVSSRQNPHQVPARCPLTLDEPGTSSAEDQHDIYTPGNWGWGGNGVPVVPLCRRAVEMSWLDGAVQPEEAKPPTHTHTQARFTNLNCMLLKAPHLRCVFVR